MIRIVLLGRTGNHLFQYALGRVLARKHDVPLVLDGSWFNAQGWAEVSHFLKLPIHAKVVRPMSLANRAMRNWFGKHRWEYLRVPFLRESTSDQSFDATFLDAPADCVLFGYFQTPKYFASMADELRSELRSLFARHVTLGDEWRAQLDRDDAVAVHVRRGDFLQIPAFRVCNEAYYDHSMQQMRESLGSVRFHVFSDDPGWCRERFRSPDVTVWETPPTAAGGPLHDLYAMSLARHHIIPNSTYSWWSAWLGKTPNQQVLMPERWYAEGSDAPKAPMAEKKI